MNAHRHLSPEEIFERVSAGETLPDPGCPACEAEAASLSCFLADLRRADAELVTATEWDDLLLRRRIRDAVAGEKPHARSIFDRFLVLRPVLVSALVAGIALAVWTPLAHRNTAGTSPSVAAQGRIPAWTPLPDESEDEGLAVLAEWTPNEDELAIARCHFACLSGLGANEEENLLQAVALNAFRSPLPEASPL